MSPPPSPPTRNPAPDTAANPKYPGIRVTCNGNTLVARHVETRITEGGVFFPITPSTEGGELYQLAYATGELDVWGNQKIAVETEGEHAAQGGATAFAVTGKRVVNFTSGQGIAYAMEQYYHAPGKCSAMVLEVGARALTKHALNVHCGHDDVYAALDTGWTILFAKNAQQAADQAIILRKVNELALNPGMNVQDGMLTTHSERAWLAPEADLLREFLGAPDASIECPTPAQRELFGPRRRRVPAMMDLRHPILLGPVENQEHHMNGVAARRNQWNEPILAFLEEAYREFGELTGRRHHLLDCHRTDDAETVFVSLGSAAENIEAACDYLREHRGAKVGSIHVNVIRPFPEAAIVEALRGKKNVIILERTDEGMAGDNPLGRDIRTALTKALEASLHGANGRIPALAPEEFPRICNGIYGIGSRDFRPEHVLGACEFAAGTTKRRDGRGIAEGEHFFVLGVDHPYAVISKDTPSLLPEGAIAARFHSIGGWGMITTGKNLGEIIGEFATVLGRETGRADLFVNANPKYGSEKKGAPTNYFLVASPEPVRVNCELNHVDIVLCCDPKAFTHTNPLAGLKKGGALVWESSEPPDRVWKRIPPKFRAFVRENGIRIFTLPGFEIARAATDRPDLQLRMQGNAFLGAFFRVSPFFETFGIDPSRFDEVVRAQYEKKFGRFGSAVVDSNMRVMDEGFSRVTEVPHGAIDDEDLSSMRLVPLIPGGVPDIIPTAGCGYPGVHPHAHEEGQPDRYPLQSLKKFDSEFRSGLGYHQPSGALASVGVMAAATGATASKHVARRETPLYLPENCTQCMECISACPDTALPNTAQDLGTILATAARHYVTDPVERERLLSILPDLESRVRKRMNAAVEARENPPFQDLLRSEVEALDGAIGAGARSEFLGILGHIPVAYAKVPAVFKSIEKKTPGAGGVFSIFVSDLCKGCGECVERCGDHQALVMVPDTAELNQHLTTAQIFSRLLPDTSQKYLGLYDGEHPGDSRPAALRNHLMVRRYYEALVSGDGACAGCGEKSILRAIASVTEAIMRPLYHRKATRLDALADRLEAEATVRLSTLRNQDPVGHRLFQRAVAHLVMGLGGENDEDTNRRLAANGPVSDEDLVAALVSALRVEAFNHQKLQATDGRLANGMSVMFMGASTGCNTVYGSTPPNNPHPYPWMNSLFQDGATISWLLGESLLLDHARRSVAPERLALALLGDRPSTGSGEGVIDEAGYWDLTHLTETHLTDQEIRELPKVWIVGGDGALGDIGFQNLSKVILQNRPHVKGVMLDTQVYSNTGGQNSDSSNMLGGYDMNQFGRASQGKLNEKKNVAEILTCGHGSPYVAQVSMANAAKLYQTVLEGLDYRGTAFFQCYTSCQPEHGVADDRSAHQAKLSRDSRGMPEFVFDPRGGETTPECFDLRGNPSPDRDWCESVFPDKTPYRFTVAHWAATEARFRKHLRVITEDEAAALIPLDDLLVLVTQDDVVRRHVFDPSHRAFVPDFGAFLRAEVDGVVRCHAVSRQAVLFCVERRKAWRLLQSRAGIVNRDYAAQRAVLARAERDRVPVDGLRANAGAWFAEELARG